MEFIVNFVEHSVAGVTENFVDAKELHTKLEVATRFDKWIQRRIDDYQFVVNEDYVELGSTGKERARLEDGTFAAKNFLLTSDMAKELSMIENNDIGRVARRYFIAVEKEWRESVKAKLADLSESRLLDHNQVLLCEKEELERNLSRAKKQIEKLEKSRRPAKELINEQRFKAALDKDTLTINKAKEIINFHKKHKDFFGKFVAVEADLKTYLERKYGYLSLTQALEQRTAYLRFKAQEILKEYGYGLVDGED